MNVNVNDEDITGGLNDSVVESQQKITHGIRKYKAGYHVKDETHFLYGDNSVRYKTAYTQSGDYIGDTKFARLLCVTKGISPELITSEYNVCSIGFSEKEQKWYGWSHRALYGFGVGSKVVKGDCAYFANTLDGEIQRGIDFWNGDHYFSVVCDGLIYNDTEADYYKIISKKHDKSTYDGDIDKLIPNKAIQGTTNTQKT